ncbi:MAG TPA: hypothetical protein VN947_21260 [Polyangia bacterium]|nr:hypothetical protein [Polyangia bacterium]
MRHLGVVLLCFAVGCGATNPTHGGGGSGGTGGGGTGGTGGGGTGGTGGGGTGGSGGGTGSGDCSDAAKLIYVIDQDGTFSSFKPDQTDITKSVFTDLGKLNCSGASLYQPFSMSVDRNAVAWVELAPLGGGASKLFNVSTANAACTPTTFMGGQQGFNEFGMGFVSNTAMSTDETLFIGGGDMVGGTSNLGTLDVTNLMITKGNALTGDPELTGTGLGDLWGFFPITGNNTMARVSKIDKMSAMESGQIPLTSLTGMAESWAFAFYGGDFWVFLATGTKATIVYHVTQTGGTQPVDMLDTKSRHIVGAGVSTCAPTTPIG